MHKPKKKKESRHEDVNYSESFYDLITSFA